MSRQDRQYATRVFRALAVEKRVEIVQLLSGRALCVGALSHLLGISAGAVSQHLRILKDAGFVEPERRGQFIHYTLAPDLSEKCRGILDALFGTQTDAAKGGQTCAAKRTAAKIRKS